MAYPLFRLRQFFYLIHPSEICHVTTAVARSAGLPLDAMIFLMTIEFIVATVQFKHNNYFNFVDGMGSMASSLAMMVEIAFSNFFYLSLYEWMHVNYAVVEFEDPCTIPVFILFAIVVDFQRYWSHRVQHEVNIFWEDHRIHHSSEYLNLSIPGRNTGMLMIVPLIQLMSLPLAFLIPPAHFYLHLTLNFNSNIWTHTSVIGRLGWLEKIIVTPSHHRVHHGRNAYCIDKNYGNTLIIWDKMFGTFAEERVDEPVLFGTIEPIQSANTLRLHWFWPRLASKFSSMPTMGTKLLSLIMGPGWLPGKNRLGDPITETADAKTPIRLERDFTFGRKIFTLLFLLFTIQACSDAVLFAQAATTPWAFGLAAFAGCSLVLCLFGKSLE